MDLNYIFELIENNITSQEHESAYVIGINGVDTSGKTKFAAGLNSYLIDRGYKTALIHMDDFHNQLSVRSKGSNEIDSYINNAFNLGLIEKELLNQIKNGLLIDKELLLLDLDSDKFTNKKHYKIDNDTVVILEGVLLYREPIERYIDYKVFLDISFEEVLKRAKLRDVPRYGVEFLERYKNKYIPIQQKYIDTYMPKQKSNIIIDNSKIKGK